MTALTTVCFIRHPETPKKPEKQHSKTKFGKQGVRESYQIARVLSRTITWVGSSEYLRAQEAAFILWRKLNKDKVSRVEVNPLFNEISRPLVDGQPYSSLNDYFQWRKEVIFHPTYQNIRSRFKDTGESYWGLFQNRVGEILNLFSEPQFSGQRVAVCTHSQLIAMTKTRIELGDTPSPEAMMATFNQSFPDYSSITTFAFSPEDGWRVIRFNDTKHLIR